MGPQLQIIITSVPGKNVVSNWQTSKGNFVTRMFHKSMQKTSHLQIGSIDTHRNKEYSKVVIQRSKQKTELYDKRTNPISSQQLQQQLQRNFISNGSLKRGPVPCRRHWQKNHRSYYYRPRTGMKVTRHKNYYRIPLLII